MTLFLILFGFCFVNAILCYDTDGSYENRIEVTPLYETIIYSDIADIIKDYENNMNTPLETVVNNDDSESDENIDELLSEYQRYLDKAHKQRRNYLEKSKSKNKVPNLTHDRYSKSKPSQTNKHDDYYPSNINYYNLDAMPLSQPQFKTPLDFLIPINMMRSRLYNNYDLTGSNLKDKSITKNPFYNTDSKILQLPPSFPLPMQEPLKTSCFCEPETLCDCGCKQCIIPLEPLAKKHSDYDKFSLSNYNQTRNDPALKDVRSMASMTDNTINIRVKVDVQFPKVQEIIGQNISSDRFLEPGSSISKESNINLPSPFFNFPMPLELLGFKKANQDSPPIHKITIHRKKKSKSNSNGKRHRKKLITFHNIKLEQSHSTPSNLEENYNTSDYQQITDNYQMNPTNETYNLTAKMEQKYGNITTKNMAELKPNNDTKPDDIFLMVNIRNNADNVTEDVHKNENSIETDFIKGSLNISTEEPALRKKRDISNHYNISAINVKKVKSSKGTVNITFVENNSIKKPEKILSEDTELLFWPNNQKALPKVKDNSENITSITTLILDTENKKVKLNLSSEAIRHNRTKALEQAIFGEVDWDDVGTVAPVFMSFMGKYIRGVLTFCSERICHSMNCAEKSCLHRTCAPRERINNKGHCTGSNITDSVASMEAIMDLPSKIALEIVDILQDKMLGKLFGKVTMCISSKCVTFVASKKSFMKTKCTTKELNATGHCSNIKTVKVM